MALFESVFRKEVTTIPESVTSQLCLLSLVDAGDNPPSSSGPDAAEIRRLMGMTPTQYRDMLQNDFTRTLFLTGLIRTLDSDDFEQRTRAFQALQLMLNSAPHLVLPRLLDARQNFLSLEHRRRLEEIIATYVSATTTTNGITTDAVGRITQVINDNGGTWIRWNNVDLDRIEEVVIFEERRFLRQIRRQANGSYEVLGVNAQTGEVVSVDTISSGDIRIIPGNPPILEYRIAHPGGGTRLYQFPLGR